MSSHIKKFIKLSSLIFLLPLSFTSLATDYTDLQAYEIEVVIFSFNQTQSAGSEIWPDLVTTESVENSIELHNSSSLTLVPGVDEKAYYYSTLPAEKFRLVEQAEKLANSNDFSVIYHNAWIQPGLNKENAEFIHIKSIENQQQISVIDPLSNVTNNQGQITPTNPLYINNNPAEADTNVLLDGVVKVELGRYLHIYFDLKYQRNLAPQQGVIDATETSYKDIKYYPVQTHRRMRSKEVHYIDHPLIGILVLATPFERPEDNEEVEMINQPLNRLQAIPLSN